MGHTFPKRSLRVHWAQDQPNRGLFVPNLCMATIWTLPASESDLQSIQISIVHLDWHKLSKDLQATTFHITFHLRIFPTGAFCILSALLMGRYGPDPEL